MRTRPLVIAHGGNSCEAPQNSMTAFEQAVEIGVDMIELDVNMTSDGHPVIFHGPNLKKTTGGEGSIHDITLEEARELDVGSWKDETFASERMLTLQEALAFAHGRVRLAVDLKTVEILPTIVKCIQDADMVDKVVVCGCSADWARQVRNCDSRLSVGLNISFKYVTEELIRLAHLRATQLWAWTVDDPEDMRRLICMGVGAIYTNYPQTLKDVLESEGLT